MIQAVVSMIYTQYTKKGQIKMHLKLQIYMLGRKKKIKPPYINLDNPLFLLLFFFLFFFWVVKVFQKCKSNGKIACKLTLHIEKTVPEVYKLEHDGLCSVHLR